MGRESLQAYLTARLRLLEVWEDTYSEYESGDPELAEVIDHLKAQVDALDQTVKFIWYEEEINDTSDIRRMRGRIQKQLEIIYEKHNKYQASLKNSLEGLIRGMRDVRKAKAFTGRVLTGNGGALSTLDTRA